MDDTPGLTEETRQRLFEVVLDYAAFRAAGEPTDPNEHVRIVLDRLTKVEEFIGECQRFADKVGKVL